MPEYQKYFSRLFSEILVTTNYDKALEKCYSSILSYSYNDLIEIRSKDDDVSDGMRHSWLYNAVIEKIDYMKDKMNGNIHIPDTVMVPDMPMLLKVHGSIERAGDIALSRSKYNLAYEGEMPKLLEEIFKKTTVIFLGCGLHEDRIMDVLQKVKSDTLKNPDEYNYHPIRHFAFLSGKENRNREDFLINTYGIYPIFYDEEKIPLKMFSNEKHRQRGYHDYCLGILVEKLLRRKLYYPRPIELLWSNDRYKEIETTALVEEARKEAIRRPDTDYVHRDEAFAIWNLLNSSDDCPLIAITGEQGSGRSTICRSIMEMQKDSKDIMHFFYISLMHCHSWEELCILLYQAVNIAGKDIPGEEQWKEVAEIVSLRCSGYWKSVLIIDNIYEVGGQEIFPQFWILMKKMLMYWKEHRTRVIFICHKCPVDLPCYTWKIGKLNNKEAKKVFFSACTLGRHREITYLEEKVVDELVKRQSFCASSIELLGIYANSKGDLSGLLDEWEIHYHTGDRDGQTVARILSNYMLDEHGYSEKTETQKKAIKENILFIWKLLGAYPGVFSSVFFDAYLENKEMSEKELWKKTLRYMKNSGLCEETDNAEHNNLIEKMVQCVNDHFVQRICSENDEEWKEIRDDFIQKMGRDGKAGDLSCGLRDFRGYKMHPYQAMLAKYVFPDVADNPQDTTDKILEIFEVIGEKVKTDEVRYEQGNRKLNQVLHYEIKSVINYLSGILTNQNTMDKNIRKVVDIGYNVAHYYHYMPQHSFTFVKHLIEKMEENQKKADQDIDSPYALYKLGKMKKVLGDIQRLLGRKNEAIKCYDDSIKLCDKHMVQVLGKESDYCECIRVKASAILAKDCYFGLKKAGEDSEALKLYRIIKDQPGEAFYLQKIGERDADNLADNDKYKSEENADESQKPQEKSFDDIRNNYNTAIKLYYENHNQTGVAYILKCMGDLIRKCHMEYENDIDGQGRCYLKKEKDEKREYYFILRKSEIDSTINNIDDKNIIKKSWKYAAVTCYIQAFYYYYIHINWRGFANVIQAMGTCYRTITDNKDNAFVKDMEGIYGLAEECYRWLGDTRGLADTLDYLGYGYREIYDKKNSVKDALALKKENNSDVDPKESLDAETYGCFAISKWKESENIWNELDDDGKVKALRKNIKDMEKNLWHRIPGINDMEMEKYDKEELKK